MHPCVRVRGTGARSGGEAGRGAAGAATGAAGGSAPLLGAQTKEVIVEVVTKMLKEYGVITKQAALDMVKGHANARVQEVTADAVMTSLHGVVTELHGGLVLKKLGGSGDAARGIVIELFKEKPQLKKADILATVSEATGQDLAATAFTKIVKELAVAKGNHWVFKTAAEPE